MILFRINMNFRKYIKEPQDYSKLSRTNEIAYIYNGSSKNI